MSERLNISQKQVNDDILKMLRTPGPVWWSIFIFDLLVLAWGAIAWRAQIAHGIGESGKTRAVGWAMYITNFVFWVGIAHCGTLISAILYLFRSYFRRAVYRASEAMTVFAVMTAGLFPIIHLGRPWFAYWILPYPNQRQVWVNFRSPLLWDVFAISTYFTVSALFFVVGLIPDVGAARDRATGTIRKLLYNVLSFGWRGSSNQWKHYYGAYIFFAALATPLVLSVHSVVSWDFAMSLLPGWHSTIFAPYFVAGAIFSGVALVINLLIPIRSVYKLEHIITTSHVEKLAKLVLLTSMIVTYSYLCEFFMAWYGDSKVERDLFWWRATGPLAWTFWIMFTCNSIIPWLLWSKKIRTNMTVLFIVCIFVNIGMWYERFVIITTSLARSFEPAMWQHFFVGPTWVEWGILWGSFAWFFMWFLLFVKFLPAVSIAEVKETATVPMREGAA